MICLSSSYMRCAPLGLCGPVPGLKVRSWCPQEELKPILLRRMKEVSPRPPAKPYGMEPFDRGK